MLSLLWDPLCLLFLLWYERIMLNSILSLFRDGTGVGESDDQSKLTKPEVAVTLHSDDDENRDRRNSDGLQKDKDEDGSDEDDVDDEAETKHEYDDNESEEVADEEADEDGEEENRGRYLSHLSTDSQTRKLDKDSWVEDAKKGEFDELIMQKRQRRVARDDSNLHSALVGEKSRAGSDSSG